MKLSRFVKFIVNNDDLILYNTFDHSVIQLPKELIDNGEILTNLLDEDSIFQLKEMCMFSDTDSIIENQIEQSLINKSKLFISLELNLSCNLRCPYCYQSGQHNGKVITDSDLDKLVEYIKTVYKVQPYNDLYLKILGGEPTLAWEKFLNVCSKCKEFCDKNSVDFHLLVDTNGTIIDKLLELKPYNGVLFTIPLTHKNCHDNMRKDARGNGTYDLILKNINVLHENLNKAKIVIRYNVDQNNISLFEDFLFDIKRRLSFLPLVSVNYTAELNGNKEYGNGLTYADFVKWSSSSAIDSLINASLPVTVSPIVSVEECQFRSKYSLKMFSDGTVGSCAMSFFDKERENIDTLLNSIKDESTCSFERKKEKQTILHDKECLNCDSIFICGGTCKLPCIKALDPDACNKKLYGISLQDFLPRYIECQEKGKNDLFVVFEEGESYR